MKDEEHKIQSDYFDWLRLNENRFPQLKYSFAIPNGGNRNIVTATKLKREGVKRGVLDIFNPLPNLSHKGLWIEMKTEKGKLSPEQRDWIEVLTMAGYSVNVCRSWTEAANVTIKYFDLKIKV